MQKFPEDFQKRMFRQLGEQTNAFLRALSEKPPTSVRLNPAKPSNRFLKEPSVPWYPEGRYLNERPEFVTDPLLFAGAYYVQEASSMFIGHIFRTFAPSSPLKVLDMCAAPGGKTTLLSSLISEDSLLVANELVSKRVNSLLENIVRWGSTNVVVTNNNIKDFAPLKGFFDVILLDAPCSGEGMFRKDFKAIQQWSENWVRSCAITQRQLIEQAVDLLAPDGILIFSTCTFSEEEDEQNILKLLSFSALMPLRVPIQPDWNILEVQVSSNGRVGYGYKFYPHLLKGEGFFATIFLKQYQDNSKKVRFSKSKLEPLSRRHLSILDEWVSSQDWKFFLHNYKLFGIHLSQEDNFKVLHQVLKIVHQGIEVGTFKNQKLIPSHALALSQKILTNLPSIELSHSQALLYLQRKDFMCESFSSFKDWVLVKHQNINLGWIKILDKRINNYYPVEMRIKKDLEM
ncbi:MAG: hypothetical protein NZM38_04935 [Cytophagales bacterium]|nr:hypothetical protein [Cytophagales bacterium]MDW8384097.1 hypothetical protein [Flammeovirgaceae bacterium]